MSLFPFWFGFVQRTLFLCDQCKQYHVLPSVVEKGSTPVGKDSGFVLLATVLLVGRCSSGNLNRSVCKVGVTGWEG